MNVARHSPGGRPAVADDPVRLGGGRVVSDGHDAVVLVISPHGATGGCSEDAPRVVVPNPCIHLSAEAEAHAEKPRHTTASCTDRERSFLQRGCQAFQVLDQHLDHRSDLIYSCSWYVLLMLTRAFGAGRDGVAVAWPDTFRPGTLPAC